MPDHYDYSGLVYLSTQDEHFEGGDLHFYDHRDLDCSPFVDTENPGPCLIQGTPTLSVAPRAGRVIIFGSGRENPHRVTPVTAGTRFVLRYEYSRYLLRILEEFSSAHLLLNFPSCLLLSFWFTCDGRRKMKSFLDGKMHVRFGESSGEGLSSGAEL